MENSRVVYVVGDNVISSLGFTTKENVEAIMAEQTGIRCHNRTDLYPQSVVASLVDDERFSNVYGSYEPNLTRLERMMLASVSDSLSRCNVDASSNRTIFIFSTTKGNIDLIRHGGDSPDVDMSVMAGKVAREFGNKKEPYVISNACISGVLAVILGQRLISSGLYDNAVLVGGDLCSEFVISGFASFKSVSPLPCRPYDIKRDGLSMGEGVASMVLSSDLSVFCGDHPVMVAGGSSSNDANHISGPSRTGEELSFAMRDALREAGMDVTDVNLVDCHGTATIYNDEMESKALGLAGLASVPLVSFKGYMGHTLGASGLMESIFSVEAIRRQVVYRTLGFETLGVPVEVNVSKSTHAAGVHTVLKTASGFGGCNAAVVFTDRAVEVPKPAVCGVRTVRNVSFRDKRLVVDGNVECESPRDSSNGDFVRSSFKRISEPTLKYGKMDEMCKLGVTVAEYLLHNIDVKAKYGERGVSMVLYNYYSSLETDREYQSLIDDRDNYNPSPKVFVYTLANIVMGEICIKHGLKGENLFLVSGRAGEEQANQIAGMIVATGRSRACIVGRVDCYRGEYVADLTLLESEQK